MNHLLKRMRKTAILTGCFAVAVVSWTYPDNAAAQSHELRLKHGPPVSSKARVQRQLTAAPAGVVATCNDGVLDVGEDCDPLELFSRLGVPVDQAVCCTSECKFAAPTTVCRQESSACDEPESCTGTSAFCPGEQLDDCCPAACGDGIVDPGEACDDGNTTGGDVCDNCGLAVCTPLLVVEGVAERARLR
jgi:cysteine-rich repeat protein